FLIVAPSERYLKNEKKQIIEVKTEQVFNYTPEQVYDAIKSVDTLTGEKPFLMNFDLPVPTKCILEKEEVGGIRMCYFNGGNLSRGDFGGGTIREKITELERGKVLRMDVTDYNLIGRKWLGFKEAIYYFDKIGDSSCKLTRVTTYTSELTPRIYWEPLEKIGISQEHDYVFSNLNNDLKKKYSR
ncbi:MAG: polyketide cyclase, partial [Ignavibacteriae bacterium]|nr:polyketide cyclase [Ignavibacteriota bacterium]